MDVRARRTIAAPPAALFAFLEAPDRHWQLLGRRLEPLRAFDGEHSRVRLRGPLGVRRTLAIWFVSSRPPHELVGRVEAGARRPDGAPRTLGTVRWSIAPAAADAAPDAAASDVELTARTAVAGPLDRLLLACGGARWLRRSLALALRRLDARVGAPAAAAPSGATTASRRAPTAATPRRAPRAAGRAARRRAP